MTLNACIAKSSFALRMCFRCLSVNGVIFPLISILVHLFRITSGAPLV